jgi:TetR/AcrR family transcriptional repressor of nem operon
MRYAADHKYRTRSRVLIEAAAALREEGPDRFSLAGVMRRVGLTDGGFYAHFASREALLGEAIGVMFDQSSKTWATLFEDASPEIALKSFILFYLSPAHRDDRASGCPIPALSGDVPRMAPGLRDSFGEGLSGFSARVAGLLRRRDRTDPEADASSLLAELVGAVALARAESDPQAADLILDRSRAALLDRFGLLAA